MARTSPAHVALSETPTFDDEGDLRVVIETPKGSRNKYAFEKRIEYDLYYLQNWSLGLDLRIIARTVVSALVSKNAY